MVRRTNLLGVACCAGVVIAPHRLPEQRVLPVDGGGPQRRHVEATALDVGDDLQPAAVVVVPLAGENHHDDYYSGATAPLQLIMFFPP